MLDRYGLSVERGFLPREDPLQRFADGFEVWEAVAADLPKLLVSGRVRQWLASIPLLDTTNLMEGKQLERAMLLLSYFGHAWVWGERIVSQSLPPQIAVPWHAVARRLGRPPILSYATHALNNWRRLDPTRPISIDNIARLVNFLGGLDEEWFVLVHIAIEANAGPVLAAASMIQYSVREAEILGVEANLNHLSSGIRQLITILEMMPERCDPRIYYLRVRPFIFGWHSNPALPIGILYEGVDEWDGQRQFFRGETGAQSSIIPSVDAVLGLKFNGDPTFAAHLTQLRDYMPPPHRAFIETLESADHANPLREFVQTGKVPTLTEAYNNAIAAIHDFRSVHLRLANLYIAKQQSDSQSNPTSTGTGGTPFVTYLATHAEQTWHHRL